MKITLIVNLLSLAWVLPVVAQNYSITSSAITAGGGTSSGGQYAVTGALAQHHASPASTGGTFSISGGFFSQYVALQQTGAPHLIIRRAGPVVQVVWGANVPGWILQLCTTGLAPANWADVTSPPTVNGGEQYHAFTTSSGGRAFFRLRKL